MPKLNDEDIKEIGRGVIARKQKSKVCDQCGTVYKEYFIFDCPDCDYEVCYRCKVDEKHVCLGAEV